jgi:nitroreductase
MAAASQLEGRVPEASVDPVFVSRWSRRAYAPTRVTSAELRSLFEAARWAPSAMNAQPWLFVYADEEEDLARFRPLLRDSNRKWAARAPVLAFLFARKHHEGKENPSARFDCGAAWMSLALQAERLGLVVRAMGGIFHDQVYDALAVPRAGFEVLCGIAIGRPGSLEDLPPELQAKETPTSRRPREQNLRRGRYTP